MITLSTGSLYPYGLNRIFHIAKAAGFSNIELIVRSPSEPGFWDTLDIKYLQQLERDNDVKIISLHIPLDFENTLEGWDEVLELAEKLKVHHVICHLPYIENNKYRGWFAKNYQKRYPFQLLAENLISTPDRQMILEKIEEWQKLPAICFDITHAMKSHPDFLEKIDSFKNIIQFHTSYFDGQNLHQNILKNKAVFTKIFNAKSAPFYCVELKYDIYKNYREETTVVNELSEIRQFIEKVIK
jgi:sugar phosphate isomerase/epimerase